jgi:hypothetical protein
MYSLSRYLWSNWQHHIPLLERLFGRPHEVTALNGYKALLGSSLGASQKPWREIIMALPSLGAGERRK